MKPQFKRNSILLILKLIVLFINCMTTLVAGNLNYYLFSYFYSRIGKVSSLKNFSPVFNLRTNLKSYRIVSLISPWIVLGPAQRSVFGSFHMLLNFSFNYSSKFVLTSFAGNVIMFTHCVTAMEQVSS